MSNTAAIPKTYEDAVQTLARWHGEDSEGVSIYAIADPDRQLVKLVEVSDQFGTTPNLQPFIFGQSEEFPFPSGVIMLTPRDWETVQSGQRHLPKGWDVKQAKWVWP